MRLVSTSFLFALTAGCAARVGYNAHVYVPPPPVVEVGVAAPVATVEVAAPPADYVEPDLVEVSPGVQVVYDYDYPVFFSDGLYWRQENGVWMSSRYHTGGWVRNDRYPERFRTIGDVNRYGHYHPEGVVHGRIGVSGRIEPRAEVRGEVHGPEVRGNVHGEVHGPEVRGNVHGEVHGPEVRGEVHGPEVRGEVHAPEVHAPEVHGEVHGNVTAGGHVNAPVHAAPRATVHSAPVHSSGNIKKK